MDSILGFVNSQSTKNLPTKDYLRFTQLIWPIPDSSYTEEDKYFNQKYTALSGEQLMMFNHLLTIGSTRFIHWSHAHLILSLRVSLTEHSELLRTDFDLAKLASKHTGAALKIDTEDGRKFSNMLKQITLTMPLVVFRTLDRDYMPELFIDKRMHTENIWSTSYDPISSIGFAASNPDIKKVYIVKVVIPAGFKGGLLVENNIGDTVKEQHEFTIGAGICFDVKDITDNVEVTLFDDARGIRSIPAKIYTLVACQ